MIIKITFYVEESTAVKLGEKGIRLKLNSDVMTMLVSDVLGRMSVKYTKLNIDYLSFVDRGSISCYVKTPNMYIDEIQLRNLIGTILYEYKGFGDIVNYTVEVVKENKSIGCENMKDAIIENVLLDKEYEVKTTLGFGFLGKPHNVEDIFKEYLDVTCGIFREYVKDRKFTNNFNEAISYDDHLEVVQKVTIYESDIENFEFINNVTANMRALEKKHKCSITTNIKITEVPK